MMKKISLAIVCCFVLVLGLELASFIFYMSGISGFYHRPWYLDQNTWQNWRTEVEDWGAWHQPLSHVRHVKACFDVEYATNSIGARDVERSRDSTERRIVMLGDSFVEGYGVDVNARISNLIEKRTGIPVLNFGSGGHFGFVQYYLIYRDLASQFRHDAVAIGFLPFNDFTDNDPDFERWNVEDYRYRPYYRRVGERFEIFYKTDKPDRIVTFDDYVDYSSAEMIYDRWFWSAGIFAQLGFIRRNRFSRGPYGSYFETSPERLQAAAYFLHQIKVLAGERPVYVFLIPVLPDLRRLRRAASPVVAAFEGFADAVGIHVIDLAPAMAAEPDWRALFLPCDGHWTAKGHQKAAEQVMRALSAEPALLPPAPR